MGTTIVLVVDDRRIVREALAAWLSASGFDARSVASEEIDSLEPADELALVSLATAQRGDQITGLTSRGRRVAVYGAWNEPQVAAAVAAGARAFVPSSDGIEDLADRCRALVDGSGEFSNEERVRLIAQSRKEARSRLDEANGLSLLTPREREVLASLIDGRRATDIAEASFVSATTVRNQIQSILTKLNVHSQVEAVAAARRHDWSP